MAGCGNNAGKDADNGAGDAVTTPNTDNDTADTNNNANGTTGTANGNDDDNGILPKDEDNNGILPDKNDLPGDDTTKDTTGDAAPGNGSFDDAKTGDSTTTPR